MRTEQQASFVEYVRSRGPWMLGVARGLCRDRHAAEDLVQTAQAKLYAHWDGVARVANLDAYVRTIILRTHLDDRRTCWATRVDRCPVVEFPSTTETDHDTRLVLREAVEGLAPKQRATILLRYYLDLSVEQTASALDITAGTVKGYTSRGLRSLRVVLERDAA
jgi:RNA polymerase sigma-70 factor (sigma-E family)